MAAIAATAVSAGESFLPYMAATCGMLGPLMTLQEDNMLNVSGGKGGGGRKCGSFAARFTALCCVFERAFVRRAHARCQEGKEGGREGRRGRVRADMQCIVCLRFTGNERVHARGKRDDQRAFCM